MSKIKIRNFGPIKQGIANNEWIDIEKITVFIGTQGSGKSTIAKLISTFTWLEKALSRGDEDEETIKEKFKERFCNYHRLGNYFWQNFEPQPKNHDEYKRFLNAQSRSDSEIHFIGSKYEFHYYEYELRITRISTIDNYIVPKIMYVPAERNFISAVDNPDKVKGLPPPLYEFLDEYDRSLQELSESLTLPIGNFKLFYRKQTKTAHIVNDNNITLLLESSSGLQSSVPLFLVSRNLALSIGKEADSSKMKISLEEENKIRTEIRKILENDKLSEEFKKAALEEFTLKYVNNGCFINIVEEPEQNLYPSSQKSMLFKLFEFANLKEGNKLITTTHSPYVINYLALAIKGESLMRKIKQSSNYKSKFTELKARLDKIVPEDSCINSEEAVIYELNENGDIIKLKNYAGLPGDDNFLNNELSEGNEEFVKLLEIEDQCQ